MDTNTHGTFPLMAPLGLQSIGILESEKMAIEKHKKKDLKELINLKAKYGPFVLGTITAIIPAGNKRKIAKSRNILL